MSLSSFETQNEEKKGKIWVKLKKMVEGFLGDYDCDIWKKLGGIIEWKSMD